MFPSNLGWISDTKYFLQNKVIDVSGHTTMNTRILIRSLKISILETFSICIEYALHCKYRGSTNLNVSESDKNRYYSLCMYVTGKEDYYTDLL